MGKYISLATGCAMNGTEDVVMAGCLVTFKPKVGHHAMNVTGFV